jgi:hypothetical protein
MKFENVVSNIEPKPYAINSMCEWVDPRFSFEKYSLFCDMDGVLTNMVKHYHDLTGKDLEDKVNNKKWYRDIQGNLDFWKTMLWLDDAKELWDYIKQYDPCILTSPTLDYACKKGKIEWVKKELGDDVCVIVALKKHLVFDEKQLVGKILIDDKEKNINPWIEMGGTGILHKNAADTISQLKKFLT